MSSNGHTGPGYASPQVAREQPAEKLIYVAALYEGTGIDKPDFIAVVDVDPASSSYGQIVGRTDASTCSTYLIPVRRGSSR